MTTITRDELYALVWTEPIQKLAPRYGLSDRGLGKLCARHDIPVPPRGWWARKAAGYKVRQAPLPPLKSGQADTIIIEKHQPKPEPVAAPEYEIPEIALEQKP
jgi:hypothetical protein